MQKAEGLFITFLHQRNLKSFTVDLEAKLALGVCNLNLAIRLSHAICKLIDDRTLRLIGLASAGLALLGLRGFLNLSLIQVALLRKVTINRHLITDLLTTGVPEDLRRNYYRLLDAVLVDEGVLEISRIHILLFLLESLLNGTFGVDRSPATPSGIQMLLGDREEGSRSALLLALLAEHAAFLDEEAKRSAHLLSGDTELRSHILVGDIVANLNELVVDVLAEVHNLLVHLRLAGTSGVALDLLDLLLAELDDLGIVSKSDGDAVVEVLLGGLDLGHDFLLSGTRVPVLVTSPFDSFFSEEVVLFDFLYIYYIIF